MADKISNHGLSPFAAEAYDAGRLPDFDREFIDEADLEEFARALNAPENIADEGSSSGSRFITALNDWSPVHQRVKGRRRAGIRRRRRGKDETREGFVHTLLKWPLLVVVFGWIIILGLLYLLTRLYIYLYEHFVAWRGRREQLRRNLHRTTGYKDWVKAAQDLDAFLGNESWKQTDEYAYYDYTTLRHVGEDLRSWRLEAEKEENDRVNSIRGIRPIDALRSLVEACVKSNFVGIENPRLYSETYYGTKRLVQDFVGEVESSLSLLVRTRQLTQDDKRLLFKHLHRNFGRTALCLSGGASFAYYHFGVCKALLDADLLPDVISGTSGGALVAALVATRTDDELKDLLVPALAGRLTACHDDFFTWFRRWCRTGARFDALDWARRCSWITRGSTTFREAYERTGRILNVTCVPSDPHSPTILANYLISPDCVIWSAVLASAAVPGILNPVVLMTKNRDGTLSPYSFGHKWKDGSLRTDIPLKALNLHFNVNFSIVSQVNPHINLFFFSSRGAVGRPVTHRRGRGWRGGFLGSAVEQYLKLDLNKWLKVLRHLELLPRPLGQDWSEIWLQKFSGTITIWPKSTISDFYYILSDPTPFRLARMLHAGQQSTFPKLQFITNRMVCERLIERGRRSTRPQAPNGVESVLSEDDLQDFLQQHSDRGNYATDTYDTYPPPKSGGTVAMADQEVPSPPTLRERLRMWRQNLSGSSRPPRRRGSGASNIIQELGRQSRVFVVDDTEGETGQSEDDVGPVGSGSAIEGG
ncbi:hypothetical protein GP486_006549 [Trichoglossum hirsutum]|uniref:Patatin-like phospholipase domain-containing protein n=1 Tax=Trichoglossum hirsutum TaxID=265104 RepID=A0A9P8IJ21_9PEZI|nr:hypothetical protein GP486_006549 [Trichoglossum hirsutum]